MERTAPHTTSSASEPRTDLATMWISLDGLIERWGRFGTEATETPALYATSEAFAALACETGALARRLQTWYTSREVDVTDLEHCLDELAQERRHWAEAGRSLEMILLDERRTETAQEAIAMLILETMEHRLRVSTLITEVEQEQLGAYRQAVSSSHKRGDGTIVS